MALSALILAIGGTPAMRWLALKLGVIDKPAARGKIHAVSVPLLGGGGHLRAFIVALLISLGIADM